MADKTLFWKGVSAGFLAGMTVAAALRYSRFEKFITNLSTVDGKIDRSLGKLEEKLHHTPEEKFEVDLARMTTLPVAGSSLAGPSLAGPSLADQPLADEPIAEPTRSHAPIAVNFAFRQEQPEHASSRTSAVASYLRSGRGGTQTLDRTGDPDARVDHLDLSKPLRPYPRNLDLGSAG